MLRVAFVNHHGGVPSGAERSLEAYLRRIPGDVDPYVFLFEDGEYADLIRSLGIPVYVVPASARLMSVTRGEIRAAHAMDAVRHVFRLSALLRPLAIDVLVTNSMKAHIVGALAARACGIPAVTWLKDLPDGFALRALRTVSLLCARERIGCSKAVARRLGLPRTTPLVPAIDVTRYVDLPSREEARELLGLPKDGLVFSIVGRIARWKGQDRFLQAAAQVCSRVPDVHFAIVGSPTFPQDHEFAPELPVLAARLGISANVSFIPWLNDTRVAYAASDLICNASTAEPFGRTSAEAAACGVPALCFDDGGAAEAIVPGVTGTVVPAEDVDAYAAAMMSYASDPAALRRAGAAARVYVQRHDGDRLAATFFEVVRRASRPKKLPAAAPNPTPAIRQVP
jgi:glycosyltransferase involved in cell wall biosynthesis